MFISQLQKKIELKHSRLCVGLDPRYEWLPDEITRPFVKKYGETLKAAARAITQFHKEVIDSIHTFIPIIKPQSAYFEQYGPAGAQALLDTIAYAKQKDVFVLLDAKRGDIDSTANAYANAYLGTTCIGNLRKKAYDVDALTINPFLGKDTLQSFITVATQYGKGIFILVKTSNPGSGDFQNARIDTQTVSEQIAHYINSVAQQTRKDNPYADIGAVVGATYPDDAKRLRILMPNSFLLIPGYGAQGGSFDVLHHFFQKNGNGAIVNASRSVVYAYMKKKDIDFRSAIVQECQKTISDINTALDVK